jgi:2,4-diaminopentanoate dehydrogenase
MPAPIRTIHWGTGAMGSRGIALALRDPRFEVAGIISARSRDRGREVLAGCGREHDATMVGRDLAEVTASGVRADVVILATQAHVRELEEQITAACRSGMHVVCIGEEALHPASADDGVSERLQREAVRNHVAVVGTGVNPGFLMDTLPLVLTAPTRRWKRLHARRVSDLSYYGWTVLQGLGIGLLPADFERAREGGGVAGHLGFPQSIAVIAEGLGIDLSIVENSFEPIVRDAATQLGEDELAPGEVIGVSQRCVAVSNAGHEVILEHPQRIGTYGESEEPFGDLIEIDGEPPLRFRIEPGIDGGGATVALMLNAVPGVFDLQPGLHPASDIPIAALGRSRRSFEDRAMQAGRTGVG